MKRILLCSDGSAYSQVCARYAAWFAKRTDCAIDSLYVSDIWKYETSFVSDIGGTLGIQPYQDMLGNLEALEGQKSGLIEAALRATFEKEGLSNRFTFHRRKGNVGEAIVGFERGPEAVSCVMLGKRGENVHTDAEHLGSTVERVVRASSKPCIVTPRAFNAPQRMALAYDGSPSAARALHWLVQASTFKDIELHVVAVAAEGQISGIHALQEAENLLHAGGWQLSNRLLTGEAGDAIADYVAHENINYLIMGAYGHSAIRRLLIGSTTTELIRRCHVPVMLFR